MKLQGYTRSPFLCRSMPHWLVGKGCQSGVGSFLKVLGGASMTLLGKRKKISINFEVD
jgi:hypothetical protein